MNARAGEPLSARVLAREVLSEHLVRIRLGQVPGFASTGIHDEWVALTVPGQFQTRYYSVRHWDGSELVLDIVVHPHGLVTEWAQTECVGDVVGIAQPKGAFHPPDDAQWLIVLGDLTALPAIARIRERCPLPGPTVIEAPAGTAEGYPDLAADDLAWRVPPGPGASALADALHDLDWPGGPGYFWMGGESGQMRAIRQHLRRELKLATSAYHVMGYWNADRSPQSRAVDPGPIYRRGKAEGKSDEAIWAEYDAARERG